jgi:hypothetical protein
MEVFKEMEEQMTAITSQGITVTNSEVVPANNLKDYNFGKIKDMINS